MPLRAISHLVERELVDRYRDAARAVHPTSDYRFLIVGPRAPYSFCGDFIDGRRTWIEAGGLT